MSEEKKSLENMYIYRSGGSNHTVGREWECVVTKRGGNLKVCEVGEMCYFIKKEVNALNAAENSSKIRIEKYSLVCYV